jgi:hypothetical protein
MFVQGYGTSEHAPEYAALMLAENRRRGNMERKVMSKIDKSWSQSGLWPAFHSTHTFLLRPLPARLSHFLSPLSRIGVNYVSTVSCLLLPAAPQSSNPVPLRKPTRE